MDKHPTAAPLHADCLISDSSTVPDYHPVSFDGLDGTVVHEAALHIIPQGQLDHLELMPMDGDVSVLLLGQFQENCVVPLLFWLEDCVHLLLTQLLSLH